MTRDCFCELQLYTDINGKYHFSDLQKQDDQLEHTYSSYVKIWDVAQKTCRRRWTIGKSGERGSGISMRAARHDDDESLFKLFKKIFFREIQKINHSWKTDVELQDVFKKNIDNNHPVFHHHVAPSAWISLTLSYHPSLSFIASGRSSKLHSVSAQSCCM